MLTLMQTGLPLEAHRDIKGVNYQVFQILTTIILKCFTYYRNKCADLEDKERLPTLDGYGKNT